MSERAAQRRGSVAGNSKAEATRARILAAGRTVYGEQGMHGTTVQRILKVAGISRPTFYKYFASAPEVIDEIVQSCNTEVEGLFLKVFAQPQSAFYDYLPVALRGYLNWGRSLGPLMIARFRELHDVSSPVSRYRDAHNERIVMILHEAMQAHGRTPPDSLALKTLVQGIEHLGYQFCAEAEHTDMPRYITVMARLCVSMLGQREDWEAMLASPFFSRLMALEG